VNITVTTEEMRRVVVFTLEGNLDHKTSADFEQKVERSIGEGNVSLILINLTSVSKVDPRGLAALAFGQSLALEKEIGYRIYGLKKKVRTFFEITRMESILKIFTTKEEALNNFAL
jgi:anti-anti-sigma factor